MFFFESFFYVFFEWKHCVNKQMNPSTFGLIFVCARIFGQIENIFGLLVVFMLFLFCFVLVIVRIIFPLFLFAQTSKKQTRK